MLDFERLEEHYGNHTKVAQYLQISSRHYRRIRNGDLKPSRPLASLIRLTLMNIDKNRVAQEECPPTKGAVGKISDQENHRPSALSPDTKTPSFLSAIVNVRMKLFKILMKSLGR